ncbi:MAG: FkbM family methyltransferase [Pseudomonadota bacterium]
MATLLERDAEGKAIRVYSQNDEEAVITEYFNGFTGRFLDIGAYDGKTFSNTYRLVELGWCGICFEPSPSVFPRLREIHRDNPRITVVQTAISDRTGRQRFYDSNGDAISTFDERHKKRWEDGAKSVFSEVEVDTVSVEEMFGTYGRNFDFINLDVESCNWEIFRAFDFAGMSMLRLICVEHDGWIEAMMKIMHPFGFHELARNAENLIAGR